MARADQLKVGDTICLNDYFASAYLKNKGGTFPFEPLFRKHEHMIKKIRKTTVGGSISTIEITIIEDNIPYYLLPNGKSCMKPDLPELFLTKEEWKQLPSYQAGDILYINPIFIQQYPLIFRGQEKIEINTIEEDDHECIKISYLNNTEVFLLKNGLYIYPNNEAFPIFYRFKERNTQIIQESSNYSLNKLSRFGTCPLCGSTGEMIFSFECTNPFCKNYKKINIDDDDDVPF